jgi:hypothetical protein
MEDWKEEVELAAFKRGVQAQLEQLEIIFKSKLELKNAANGSMSSLVSKIIDNIQIDIKNIYIRMEDSISNTSLPWCFGATLGSISIYTTNDSWERDFVTDKQITKKAIKLENFAMFLNFKKDISYEAMT